MDQIDATSNVYIQQHIDHHDLPFQYSLNYTNQFFQQDNEKNDSVIQSSNVEYTEDENEEIPMAIVYKKRIRTKFSQEQLDVLETTFQQHRYPSVDVVDDLVEQLNLPTQKITVWFQNRRARYKKSQQKLDNQHSSEKDEQQQYDSGIHLDEDVSSDSPRSPPVNPSPYLPPPPLPPPPLMTMPSPYYLPNSHHSFYNPMWSNFHYPLPSISNASNIPYNFMNYNSSEISSPFVFQDISNYQHQRDFHGEP